MSVANGIRYPDSIPNLPSRANGSRMPVSSFTPYFEKKTDNLLMLIRNAISRGIRFNYLLQYNILSLAKRLLDYQSLGELFKHAGVETLELTIVEKIWGYLLDKLIKLYY
jgi:hypothetical protein